MQKEKEKYYFQLNNKIRNSTLEILEKKLLLKKYFSKTRAYDLTNLDNIKNENEIGGPLSKNQEIKLIMLFMMCVDLNYLEKFLSVPLAAPIEKYYITSSYGYRKDPYTKEKPFIKV